MIAAMNDFDGRVAVITGAARGMGLAVAKALADRGATTVLSDVRDGTLQDVAEEIEGASAVVTDVTDRTAVRDLIGGAIATHGRLDILVNNAGVLYPTRFLEIDDDEWRRTFAVNVDGVFFLTQEAGRVMRDAGYGRIVNMASTAGKTVSTLGGAHYTASKHAVLGITRAAALELAPHGITVNAVCPGLIDTEMARENADPARLQAYESSFPIPRLGRPEEVADLVCFLASVQAGYITGAAVDISGGDLMG
jgi:3-oxoacyl-[acyl-carrier protein] reductase